MADSLLHGTCVCSHTVTHRHTCPPTVAQGHTDSHVCTPPTKTSRPDLGHTQTQKGQRHTQKPVGHRTRLPPAPPQSCPRAAVCPHRTPDSRPPTPAPLQLRPYLSNLRGSRGCGDSNPQPRRCGSGMPLPDQPQVRAGLRGCTGLRRELLPSRCQTRRRSLARSWGMGRSLPLPRRRGPEGGVRGRREGGVAAPPAPALDVL